MSIIFIYVLASVLGISLISFVGIFTLSLKMEKLKKITFLLVSLSAGTLLGGAFLHLIPETIEENGSTENLWLAILFGILFFFFLEKIVCWRHCHIPTSEDHPHHLGIMNLIGDAFHNFLDGVIIAAAYLVDINLGLVTTIAVITHEIPQEIGDFGVLIHAGYSRAKALMLNFFIALTSVLGAVLTLLSSRFIENMIPFIIPITAGGFIYIATADLIPELKKDTGPKKSILQFITILIGIGIMILLKH